MILLLSMVFVTAIACNKTPESIAGLTAPIAYAMVKNALEQNKIEGDLNIRIKFQNLKKGGGDWPSVKITFIVESGEFPGKQVLVDYILDGTYNATAFVSMPGKSMTQMKVNLAESAVVFGQTENVEGIIQKLARKLAEDTPKNIKIAVLDITGLYDEETIFGKRLSESLITHLLGCRMTIVERKMLSKAFD